MEGGWRGEGRQREGREKGEGGEIGRKGGERDEG